MTQSQNLLWWQRGVVYQIYPRSFKNSTGNGIGDLQGIINKLDYLNDGTEQSLGINAIWISPMYPSPMADFGYDVADYCDINEMFGDLETFDRLVAEAHKRDIRIIIDYVPNHSSDQHSWFIESRSSQDNPKADWYIWRDPKPDGSLPNNWGSAFGGPAWDWDENRQQYYLHTFLKEQPGLNWRNPGLRQAMMDVLRFWMERGVDGFRMDVVGMIIKHPDLLDNPPNPDASPALPANDIFARQLNIHNQDQDEVHEVLKEMRQVMDEYSERCGIGEVWYELSRWLKYYGENGDELHMPFNFGFMGLPWTVQAIRGLVDLMEANLPTFAWPNYVLGNHDNDRIASRFGLPQARIAAMLLLTLRGTPTLYFGDEIGMENGVISPDQIQDPQGINLGAERTRDRGRTPMQWDDSDYAGFSTTTPWLPVSSDYKTRNAAAQIGDITSMFNLYRRLLWYRHRSPVLQGGSYRALDTNHDDCFVYLREYEEACCLVALNFTGETKDLTLPINQTGRVVISTHLDRGEDISGHTLSLRPNEGIIVDCQLT
jgi:alpha-glucosidase